jgi:hypothetical protein
MGRGEARSTLEVGNKHSIHENSLERDMLKEKMQADIGFEFEEETKEASLRAEKGMSIHQRLAARISK